MGISIWYTLGALDLLLAVLNASTGDYRMALCRLVMALSMFYIALLIRRIAKLERNALLSGNRRILG